MSEGMYEGVLNKCIISGVSGVRCHLPLPPAFDFGDPFLPVIEPESFPATLP